MDWYKIKVEWDDVADGLHITVQKEFESIFFELVAPEEMALFGELSLQSRESPCFNLYLTPSCLPKMQTLVNTYNGVSCENPKKQGIRLALLVGRAKAWELLER